MKVIMVKKLTPAQQQYADLKAQHKDCLLLFRLGDFYELFHDDAKTAHKVLGLTLTAKNKNSDNPIPMAGIPHHALDKYLPKLIEQGFKVAIAEQVGEVVPGRVVERVVKKVITPGTYIEENRETVHVAAVRFGGDGEKPYNCAWGDFTLGSYFTKSVASLAGVASLFQLISPKEYIVHVDFPEKEEIGLLALEQDALVTVHDHPFDIASYLESLTGTSSLEGFGLALKGGRECALATLFSYLEQIQKQTLGGIQSIHFKKESGVVQLDPITVRNLEIFRSSYEGTQQHSLNGVINKCSTAMGKRLLKDWLLEPINDSEELKRRQGYIKRYSDEKQITKQMHGVLGSITDIPRILRRILYSKQSPLVVQGLRNVLLSIDSDEILLDELVLLGMSERNRLKSLTALLGDAMQDGTLQQQGGFIKDGYDIEVDKLRQIAFHSDNDLLGYHKELVEYTSIKNIKLKYVTNQGYCIEVTKKDSQLLESSIDETNEKFSFIRRQSLKGSERFVTPYLSSLEEEVLTAREVLHAREYEILGGLCDTITQSVGLLDDLSYYLGLLDVSVSASVLLVQGNWVIPTFTNSSFDVKIIGGRHPVVEAFLPSDQEFIPNDCIFREDSFFHCITGPNMGGKSTYLRQNAIIYLLGHVGLPVPAESASIPLIDGLYARVGSGDALAKNQSTFMTEMIEMANILSSATANSFIVLDELGRGTSTYDGLSLAKAISVYICQEIKAPTLFATHYHELISLKDSIVGFDNRSVSVYESDDSVVFLKKIAHGGVSKSYGIDVAKLAGVPQGILTLAQKYLTQLTNDSLKSNAGIPVQEGFDFGVIRDESTDKVKAIGKLLESISINEITPIEALIKLQEVSEIMNSGNN